jgi:transcriptional regulator with XRE-family HTH domain
MAVNERIKSARIEAGLTQRQLAAATGLALTTVSRIERGHVSPTLASLERIAAAMGPTIAAITTGAADE